MEFPIFDLYQTDYFLYQNGVLVVYLRILKRYDLDKEYHTILSSRGTRELRK